MYSLFNNITLTANSMPVESSPNIHIFSIRYIKTFLQWVTISNTSALYLDNFDSKITHKRTKMCKMWHYIGHVYLEYGNWMKKAECFLVQLQLETGTSGFSKLMYWNLIPSRVGFGRWLGHKDGASWMRFSALKKESPENPLGSPTMQGYREKTAIYETGNWASPDKEYLAPWSKTSQPPELWAINFCCLHYSWTTESIVFVYSSPNGLRHLANCLCSQRFRFFLCKTRIIIHFSETSYDE